MSTTSSDNFSNRFELFEITLQTACEVRGSELLNITPNISGISMRDVMNCLSPKLLLTMIFSIIFDIKTPEIINNGLKLKIKKEYCQIIDRTIQIKQFNSINLSNYKKGLIKLLDVLDLSQESRLDATLAIFTYVCNSVKSDQSDKSDKCEYFDALFELFSKCIQFMRDTYNQNAICVNRSKIGHI